MKIFNKFLLYVSALIYSPFIFIRVVVASILLVDSWCDKVIYGFLDDVQKQIKEEDKLDAFKDELIKKTENMICRARENYDLEAYESVLSAMRNLQVHIKKL